MKAMHEREVIVEIERLQIIRKRARTSLIYCGGCKRGGDFIELEEASGLFKTPAQALLRTLTENKCHLLGDKSAPLICLNSLLELMRRLNEQNVSRRIS